MGYKKLIRFEEIKTFPNVLIFPQDMPGKWASFFGNDHPVTLELACGKGEYTIGLARMHPDRNFIGVDIKGNRIWKGARAAQVECLKNVAFLRTDIMGLTEYFGQGEVREIWIPFADPYLRQSKQKKRLTHTRFLRLYHRILAPGGKIHLKTDSAELYSFTLDTLQAQHCELINHIQDIHAAGIPEGALGIRTYYENLHLKAGKTIKYLSFRFPDEHTHTQTQIDAAIVEERY
ncbi:MAG TPA: tRNA (guanosine(46)-N7)-methyltransferase TrmB [Chitinophagaceae bacterium]|nr:tRNA (guanosine(46)-N7)-methyltransferase TrmB [Chitinophagaceae bacterium]